MWFKPTRPRRRPVERRGGNGTLALLMKNSWGYPFSLMRRSRARCLCWLLPRTAHHISHEDLTRCPPRASCKIHKLRYQRSTPLSMSALLASSNDRQTRLARLRVLLWSILLIPSTRGADPGSHATTPKPARTLSAQEGARHPRHA